MTQIQSTPLLFDPANEVEEWRPVIGFEGLYSVSSFGRVRRDAPTIGTRAGHILKPAHGRYLHLDLRKDGKAHTRYVHQVVALAFIGPPPTPEHEVNHCDTDHTNNRVSNLEWVTPKQNTQHAARAGLMSRPHNIGATNPKAKLTDDDVRSIRQLRSTASTSELARRFGVDPTAIRRIVRGDGWSHLLIPHDQ